MLLRLLLVVTHTLQAALPPTMAGQHGWLLCLLLKDAG
jgi:hypothetical protein